MDAAPEDRLDAVRDAIVAALDQFERRIAARLRAVGMRPGDLDTPKVRMHSPSEVEEQSRRLESRLTTLEAGLSTCVATTASLAGDMLQRLRALEDRIAAIARRLVG